MNQTYIILSAVGYGLAAIAFLVLTVLLLTSFRERLHGLFMAAATALTAIWAAAYSFGAGFLAATPLRVFLLEFLIDLGWLVFLASFLSGSVGSGAFRLLRYGGVAGVAAILLAGLGLEVAASNGYTTYRAESLLIFGQIVTSLIVLVYVEQVTRNVRQSQLDGLKYLSLAIGALFAYDLVYFSNAVVAGELSGTFWAVRGYLVLMCAPLIGLALSRSENFSGGIFVSRQIVFHTATLFAAGLYLVFIGGAGQFIRELGGDVGQMLQLLFLVAATLVFLFFVLSDKARAKARVFVSKHFYKNRYDYREEWLRLISTLTDDDDPLTLEKRSVKALADIVNSPSGHLWGSRNPAEPFRCVAGWNARETEALVAREDALAAFIEKSGWVIDLEEFEAHPDRYDNAGFEVSGLGEDVRFVVPLIHHGSLLGFVTLAEPRIEISLNFEDRDLLKTAGKQIASYVAQENATVELSEAKQFEAFNRLTTYLMHDLKNIIAQQSLVVENAKKHKDKPEFIDDAIVTIQEGVNRMRGVIDQLRSRSGGPTSERVELSAVIMKAISLCGSRKPDPSARVGDERVFTVADRERLQMAVYHAIRNAQDACAADDTVTVRLEADDAHCRIVVSDTGAGMDAAFVRDRLFKPFDSTKGARGMGIGAYQIRETIQSLGGEVDVLSTPGEGTDLVMVLNRV